MGKRTWLGLLVVSTFALLSGCSWFGGDAPKAAAERDAKAREQRDAADRDAKAKQQSAPPQTTPSEPPPAAAPATPELAPTAPKS